MSTNAIDIADFALTTLSKNYLKKLPLYTFQKTVLSFNDKNDEQTDMLIGSRGSNSLFDIFIMSMNAIDSTEFPVTTLFNDISRN